MSTHEMQYAARNAPVLEQEAPDRVEYLATSPRTVRVRELAEQVAETDAPVLIIGESGVGKELLARFIRDRSERADRPFLKINCDAVPSELLESELFGHERGAFAGAHQRKAGKLEAAGAGTIVLDEIGEMSLPLQAKLLHVLENGSFCRLGGSQPVPMDACIVATASRPLEQAIAAGEFRKDLYFRLKVVWIEIPPLRERKEDIPLLAEHFLDFYSDRYDADVESVPGRLIDAFMEYEWPGNVRELKHLVQQYLILSDEEMILAELRSARRGLSEGSAVAARKLDDDGVRDSLPRGMETGAFRAFPAPSHDDRRAAGAAHGDQDGRRGRNRPGAADESSGSEAAIRAGAGRDGIGRESDEDRPTGSNGRPNGDPVAEILFGVDLSNRQSKIPLKTIAARAAAAAEKEVILRILQDCRWNRKRAASRLDICYKTLLNKIDRWDLDSDGGEAAAGVPGPGPALGRPVL